MEKSTDFELLVSKILKFFIFHLKQIFIHEKYLTERSDHPFNSDEIKKIDNSGLTSNLFEGNLKMLHRILRFYTKILHLKNM